VHAMHPESNRTKQKTLGFRLRDVWGVLSPLRCGGHFIKGKTQK
jgi:hypothetical protein